MAVKSISVRCVGLFAIGWTLWLGGQSSLANETALPGQPVSTAVQTPPVTATYPTTNSQPQTVATPPGGQQQLSPIPSTDQPQASPIPASTPQAAVPQNSGVCEESDCADFCGASLCSPPGRFWLRAEYLAWWTNGMRLPPLVTTAPQGESPNLDNPNTTVLYGDETVGTNMRSGFRATIGTWLDPCHKYSIEFDYFTIGDQTNGFSLFSNGDTVLGRPFYDVYDGRQAAQLVASTDVVQGTVGADVMSYFQSAGVTLGYNLCNGCNSCCDDCDDGSCEETCDAKCGRTCGVPSLHCCRTDLLVGFRYYDLTERVGVSEDLLVTQSSSPFLGTTYVIHDNFRTRNQFYGSEIGLRTQLYRGRWSLDILTKIAMGNTHQTITINGTTDITPLGGSTQRLNEGILAVGTNSGTFQRDTLTLIPQLNLKLGYQLTCHWRAYIGYDILYWGAVARAADQIDLNVDPRNWPSELSPSPTTGLPFPQFSGRTSSFWAQGISLGTEFRY
jgi:hypothetical protein